MSLLRFPCRFLPYSFFRIYMYDGLMCCLSYIRPIFEIYKCCFRTVSFADIFRTGIAFCHNVSDFFLSLRLNPNLLRLFVRKLQRF